MLIARFFYLEALVVHWKTKKQKRKHERKAHFIIDKNDFISKISFTSGSFPTLQVCILSALLQQGLLPYSELGSLQSQLLFNPYHFLVTVYFAFVSSLAVQTPLGQGFLNVCIF